MYQETVTPPPPENTENINESKLLMIRVYVFLTDNRQFLFLLQMTIRSLNWNNFQSICTLANMTVIKKKIIIRFNGSESSFKLFFNIISGINEFDDMESITYILRQETTDIKLIEKENEALNVPMLTPGMSTDKAVQLVRHFFETDVVRTQHSLHHQRQQQWSSLPVSSQLSVFSTNSSSDEGVESIDTSSCSPVNGPDDSINPNCVDLQPTSPKPATISQQERRSRSPHKSRIPLRVPRPLSSAPTTSGAIRNDPPSRLPTRSRSSHPLQFNNKQTIQNDNQTGSSKHRRRPSLPNAAGLTRASSEADGLSSSTSLYSSLSSMSLKSSNKCKSGSWNNQPKKIHAHQFCSNY